MPDPTHYTYRCLNCESDTKDPCVAVTVYLTVPDALGAAMPKAFAALGLNPNDWLLFYDPEADAYWVMSRNALRANGRRFSAARVVSHGADLVLRQALEGAKP